MCRYLTKRGGLWKGSIISSWTDRRSSSQWQQSKNRRRDAQGKRLVVILYEVQAGLMELVGVCDPQESFEEKMMLAQRGTS